MTWGDGVLILGILFGALVLAFVLLAAWEMFNDWAERRVAAMYAEADVPYGPVDDAWATVIRETPIHDDLLAEQLRAELDQWGRPA